MYIGIANLSRYLWVLNQFTSSWVGNTKCLRNVLATTGIAPRNSGLIVQRSTTTLPLHTTCSFRHDTASWFHFPRCFLKYSQQVVRMHFDVHCSCFRQFSICANIILPRNLADCQTKWFGLFISVYLSLLPATHLSG